MFRTTPRRVPWSVLGAALVLVSPSPAPCLAADLPPQVRAGLEAGEKAVARVNVTWDERRTSPFALPDLQKKIRNTDTALLKPRTVRFTRDAKQAYYSCEIGVAGKDFLDQTETSYDGSHLYIGSRSQDPARGDPVLIVSTIEAFRKDRGDWSVLTVDYLRHAGFQVPETAAKIDAPTRSVVLASLAEGYTLAAVTEAKIGEVACVVLDLKPPPATPAAKDKPKVPAAIRHARRVFLDPAKGYAVVRSEEHGPKGELAVVVENSEFAQVIDQAGSAAWLPKRSRVAHHSATTAPRLYTADPMYVVDYMVKSVTTAAPTPGVFALDNSYKRPGTAVSTGKIAGAEKRPDGRVDFIIPANPADLDEAVQAALEGRTFVPRSRGPVLRRVVVITTVALGVVAVGVVFYRRKLRKAAEGQA